MNQKRDILTTVFFVGVTFVVGIAQGISEIKKGETIQFLEPFEDTFITPFKNRKGTAKRFTDFEKGLTELRDQCGHDNDLDDAMSGQWTVREELAERASYAIEDIKKSVMHVNRYRDRKAESGRVLQLDSLAELFAVFNDEMQDRKGSEALGASLGAIQSYTEKIKRNYRSPGLLDYPVMTVNHFITYTIFNREYLRNFEKELEKTSIFANALRPVMQGVRFTFLRDYGEKAIAGKSPWLFYKHGVMYLMRPYIYDRRSTVVDPEDEPVNDNVIDTIVAFKEALASYGIELLVMIVPGKASIYPDVINPRIDPIEACTSGHSMRLMRSLHQRGVETVDLFTPFYEARRDDAACGDSLYMAQDTHWRTRGPRIAARAVAEHIRKKQWYDSIQYRAEYALDTLAVDRTGDVAVMTNLPALELPWIRKSFITERTICHQVFVVRRDSAGSVVSKNLYRDDFPHADILVIGDSFSRVFQTDAPRSAGWISHLAYELSVPLCSIVSDGGASTLVREKLARKKGVLRGKKLVVWEFIERDIRFGAEGWKNVKL